MNDFSATLRYVSDKLHKLANDSVDMTFTPSEEAMIWPIAIIVDEDGEAGIWCANDDCLLDGHNSRIDGFPLGDFNMAHLADCVSAHIKLNRERAAA